MNRRGFLGFLGGAAATGPKLASDLASQAATGARLGGSAASYIGANIPPYPGPNSEWKISRIADLKRLLTGNEDPDAEFNRKRQRLYNAETAERFRLDSLRSVSPSYKVAMLADGEYARNRRIERMHQERELADLLKSPFG